MRLTYVGELGYELYVPAEEAAHAYDALLAAGAPHGLRPCGLKALNSLRLEKGYRDYGHDVDNTDRLVEAGLAFTCAFGKPGGFVGADAVRAHRAEAKERGGPARRLVQVRCADPRPLMHHGEVVYRDGHVVGDVRAASYGHTLGGAVGLAMVEPPNGERATKRFVESGAWELDIAGERFPAVASLRPMYDPENLRIKA